MRMGASILERREALQRRLITAVTGEQEARDAPDCSPGHAREVVDLAIGQAVLQVLDDGPAVDEGLELRRRAEVGEELLAFVLVAQAQDGAVKPLLRASRVPSRSTAIRLHQRPPVSMK